MLVTLVGYWHLFWKVSILLFLSTNHSNLENFISQLILFKITLSFILRSISFGWSTISILWQGIRWNHINMSQKGIIKVWSWFAKSKQVNFAPPVDGHLRISTAVLWFRQSFGVTQWIGSREMWPVASVVCSFPKGTLLSPALKTQPACFGPCQWLKSL